MIKVRTLKALFAAACMLRDLGLNIDILAIDDRLRNAEMAAGVYETWIGTDGQVTSHRLEILKEVNAMFA